MGLTEEITSILSSTAKSVVESQGFIEVLVDAKDVREAASKLKSKGFDHVKSVTAVDYKEEGKIKVIYHASSYTVEDYTGVLVGLAVEVPREGEPELESLVGVWPSVEFMEREVYEFFGVRFKGHPDLRPLLLIPELAEKRVLRKDFEVREESIYEGVPFSYE